MSDALHKREKALENEFFAKKDQQLRDKLKATFDQEVTRESLKAATGITDATVLERLVFLARVRGRSDAKVLSDFLAEVDRRRGRSIQ